MRGGAGQCWRVELGCRGAWEGKKSRDGRTGVDKPGVIREPQCGAQKQGDVCQVMQGARLALTSLGGVPQCPLPSLAQLAQEHSDLIAPPSPRHSACPHVQRM